MLHCIITYVTTQWATNNFGTSIGPLYWTLRTSGGCTTNTVGRSTGRPQDYMAQRNWTSRVNPTGRQNRIFGRAWTYANSVKILPDVQKTSVEWPICWTQWGFWSLSRAELDFLCIFGTFRISYPEGAQKSTESTALDVIMTKSLTISSGAPMGSL